jgi:hypothetical protein
MITSLLVLLSTAAFAQPAKFEVASVKPAVRTTRGAQERTGGVGGSGCPTSSKMNAGRVEVQCATLAMLIGYAFRIFGDRVTGPDWMTNSGPPRFDIVAKIPHRTVYPLVVAKGGPVLKKAAGDPQQPESLEGFFGAVQTLSIPNADGRSSTTLLSSPRMGTVSQTGNTWTPHWEAPAISAAGLADLLDRVAP